MNQCCLHKSKVVHEREKRNQIQMACYIYFSGKGQMVAKSNNIGVRCSRNVGVWCLTIEICQSSIVKIDWCLTVVRIRHFISNPFLLACSMLLPSTLLPVCFQLPVFTLWLRLPPCADAQSSHAYFQQSKYPAPLIGPQILKPRGLWTTVSITTVFWSRGESCFSSTVW